jgi:hypothetical protein
VRQTNVMTILQNIHVNCFFHGTFPFAIFAVKSILSAYALLLRCIAESPSASQRIASHIMSAPLPSWYHMQREHAPSAPAYLPVPYMRHSLAVVAVVLICVCVCVC